MGERTTQFSDVSGDVDVVDDDGTVTDKVDTYYLDLDGERVEYEALTSEQNGIRKALEQYLGEGFAKARKSKAPAAGSGRARPSSGSRGGGGGNLGELSRAESKTCRAWALEQGYEVSDRGRVPNAARKAWEEKGRPEPRNSQVTARADAGEADPDGEHGEQHGEQQDEAPADEDAPEPALTGA